MRGPPLCAAAPRTRIWITEEQRLDAPRSSRLPRVGAVAELGRDRHEQRRADLLADDRRAEALHVSGRRERDRRAAVALVEDLAGLPARRPGSPADGESAAVTTSPSPSSSTAMTQIAGRSGCRQRHDRGVVRVEGDLGDVGHPFGGHERLDDADEIDARRPAARPARSPTSALPASPKASAAGMTPTMRDPIVPQRTVLTRPGRYWASSTVRVKSSASVVSGRARRFAGSRR